MHNDYSAVLKHDKVYYENKQGQTHFGKAVLYGPAGWVISCAHGPQVVNQGNYVGHRQSKSRADDHIGKWLNQGGTNA